MATLGFLSAGCVMLNATKGKEVGTCHIAEDQSYTCGYNYNTKTNFVAFRQVTFKGDGTTSTCSEFRALFPAKLWKGECDKTADSMKQEKTHECAITESATCEDPADADMVKRSAIIMIVVGSLSGAVFLGALCGFCVCILADCMHGDAAKGSSPTLVGQPQV